MQWEQGLGILAKRKVRFKERTALLPQCLCEVLHVYLFADFLEALGSESYSQGNHPSSNIRVKHDFFTHVSPLGIAGALTKTAHIAMLAQVLHQPPPA